MRHQAKWTVCALACALTATSCTLSMKTRKERVESDRGENTYTYSETPGGISFYARDINVHLAMGDTFALRMVGNKTDLKSIKVEMDSHDKGGHISVMRTENCLNDIETPVDVYMTTPKFGAMSFHNSGVTIDNTMPIETSYLNVDCRLRIKNRFAANTSAQLTLKGVKCDSLRVVGNCSSSLKLEDLTVSELIRVVATGKTEVSLTGTADSIDVKATEGCKIDTSLLTKNNKP